MRLLRRTGTDIIGCGPEARKTIVLAAANRFKLLPKAKEGVIARNVVIELSIGAIVVLLGGALGQLQPLL